MNVSLTDEMKDFVHNKVAEGNFPSEEAVLQETLRRFRDEDRLRCRAHAAENSPSEDLTDYEAIAYCAREVEGKDVLSIEEVRRTLANIHGLMAQAVIEEREDRSRQTREDTADPYARRDSARGCPLDSTAFRNQFVRLATEGFVTSRYSMG